MLNSSNIQLNFITMTVCAILLCIVNYVSTYINRSISCINVHTYMVPLKANFALTRQLFARLTTACYTQLMILEQISVCIES